MGFESVQFKINDKVLLWFWYMGIFTINYYIIPIFFKFNVLQAKRKEQLFYCRI